jgi:hypothetical protein
MGAIVAATPAVDSRAMRLVPDDRKSVLPIVIVPPVGARRRMEHPRALDFGDYKSSCSELMKQVDNAPYTLRSNIIHPSFYRLKLHAWLRTLYPIRRVQCAELICSQRGGKEVPSLGLAYSGMAGCFTVLHWHENGKKMMITGAVCREVQLSNGYKESDTVMVRHHLVQPRLVGDGIVRDRKTDPVRIAASTAATPHPIVPRVVG